MKKGHGQNQRIFSFSFVEYMDTMHVCTQVVEKLIDASENRKFIVKNLNCVNKLQKNIYKNTAHFVNDLIDCTINKHSTA